MSSNTPGTRGVKCSECSPSHATAYARNRRLRRPSPGNQLGCGGFTRHANLSYGRDDDGVLKSTTRPCESVGRPSSRICSSELEQVGVSLLLPRRTAGGEGLAADLRSAGRPHRSHNVAGRRTEQTETVFPVPTAIQGDERIIAEQELRQVLASFGLYLNTGRAGEDERTIGAAWPWHLRGYGE